MPDFLRGETLRMARSPRTFGSVMCPVTERRPRTVSNGIRTGKDARCTEHRSHPRERVGPFPQAAGHEARPPLPPVRGASHHVPRTFFCPRPRGHTRGHTWGHTRGVTRAVRKCFGLDGGMRKSRGGYAVRRLSWPSTPIRFRPGGSCRRWQVRCERSDRQPRGGAPESPEGNPWQGAPCRP